jgi:HAD superfamily hydrolase (TIGR01484 family)
MFSDILLTVDFDRTLTAPDSTIPARNIQAIQYFIDNGGAFTVNTGRSIPMSQRYVREVPGNAPLLLYNGSAAYDHRTGELSFAHTIDLDMWETVAQLRALFPDLTVELQGIDAHYLFSGDPAWYAFSDHNHCANADATPGTDLGPFLKLALYGQIRDVTVADLFNASAEELAYMDQVERTIKDRFGEHLEVFRAAARIIDLHAKGVSKIRSARQLQQQLGRKILVCVGDAHNDIPMLDGADHAYCPADGVVADRYENVCKCALGAVADVIYEKIPEILAGNLDK